MMNHDDEVGLLTVGTATITFEHEEKANPWCSTGGQSITNDNSNANPCLQSKQWDTLCLLDHVIDAIAVDNRLIILLKYHFGQCETKVIVYELQTKRTKGLLNFPKILYHMNAHLIKNHLYITGIGSDEFTYGFEIWRINMLKSDHWEQVLQTGFNGHKTASDDTCIYFTTENITSEEDNITYIYVHRFNTETNSLSNFPNLKTSIFYYCYESHAMTIIDGKLFIFGGTDEEDETQEYSCVQYLNVRKRQNQWKNAPNLPRGLLRMIALPIYNRFVVLVHPNTTPLYIFDMNTLDWLDRVELTFPYNYHQTAVMMSNGRIFNICPNTREEDYFIIQSIKIQYLFALNWYILRQFILCRDLIKNDQLIALNKNGAILESIIFKLVMDTDDDIFKKILSFLISTPKELQDY